MVVVVAPDDGVISARLATVGSLTQSGQELFRLIRGGRLEWRAEVSSADLGKLQAGMPALLTGPAGEQWEVYTVLADSDTFGTSPDLLAADPAGGCSCDACDTPDTAADRDTVGATACC